VVGVEAGRYRFASEGERDLIEETMTVCARWEKKNDVGDVDVKAGNSPNGPDLWSLVSDLRQGAMLVVGSSKKR